MKRGAVRFRYSQVNLWKGANSINYLVHRLVALAFLPNPDNLPYVCHKVESAELNNSIRNLWWGSQKDNIRDCVAKGRFNAGYKHKALTPGEKAQRSEVVNKLLNKKSQLKVFDTLADLNSLETRLTIKNLTNYRGLLTDVASIFGVSKEAIRKIRLCSVNK